MPGKPANRRFLMCGCGASKDESAQSLKPTLLGVRLGNGVGQNGFTQNGLGERPRFGRCGDDPRTASMPRNEHGTPVLVRVYDESNVDDQALTGSLVNGQAVAIGSLESSKTDAHLTSTRESG
jgi:hypothetical protein